MYPSSIKQVSMSMLSGGQSQVVSISTSSAQSTAIPSGSAVLCSTVACWVRQGSNPTALSNGTDQYLPAGMPMRFTGINPGNKIAAISSESGSLYITPDA